MSIEYNPQSWEELFIPNKCNLLGFLETQHNKNDYNIAIIGPNGSCKTHVCRLILNDFLDKHKNISKEKILFTFNTFTDINLNNTVNELTIFCKNNINCNKLVYMENFDDLTETQQQQLKIYIDKFNIFKPYNKVFFLIKTSQVTNMKDVIRSRFSIHTLSILDKESKESIMNNLSMTLFKLNIAHNIFDMSKQDLQYYRFSEHTMQYILNIPNFTTYTMTAFFTKLFLLCELPCNIEAKNVHSFIDIIDTTKFENYMTHIKEKKYKDACDILTELYDEGYDICDIYFFFYKYIKQKIECEGNQIYREEYRVIERLCYYINEVYYGNYEKIMFQFLTLDIIDIYHKMDNADLLISRY